LLLLHQKHLKTAIIVIDCLAYWQWLIIEKKYDSLVVFHPGIVDFMQKNKMPFYYRKKEIKYSGTTNQIYDIFKQKSTMQDGDGDVIFT